MDADRFDALVQVLGTAVGRRSALGGVLGAGLVAFLSDAGRDEAAARKHRRNKKKRCRGGKKKCGKTCIPKANCCRDADCGTNERCTAGACEPCLGQGSDCTDDDQCCTGICDTYTEKCQQVRVECNNGESCPNGRCCEVFSPTNKQCLYVTATQGACVPDGEPNASCGYVVCGDACSDITDGTYEFGGFYGSAACRNGRSCCPQGVPLAACATQPDGGGLLPRCD